MGTLERAVFYGGSTGKAQCCYKCFMLSRLQFSIETKKSAVVKAAAVVPQLSPASVLRFLPSPVPELSPAHS